MAELGLDPGLLSPSPVSYPLYHAAFPMPLAPLRDCPFRGYPDQGTSWFCERCIHSYSHMTECESKHQHPQVTLVSSDWNLSHCRHLGFGANMAALSERPDRLRLGDGERRRENSELAHNGSINRLLSHSVNALAF